jgi:hypothetical protein
MDAPAFPHDQTFTAVHGPSCPWCDAYGIADAVVTLEALSQAHYDGALHGVAREPNGAAPPGALTVDCPACGRPSMIVLAVVPGRLPELRLIPVRTAADVTYLFPQPP